MRRSKPACLACALCFLWAASALATQAVPAPAESQFFNNYRRRSPITQWPLKKILHEIPELAGLEPASDQSRLPEEVDVTVEAGNSTLVNRHRYSDYRLFKVEVSQPADEPGPPSAQYP
jgi:hypothetical protein